MNATDEPAGDQAAGAPDLAKAAASCAALSCLTRPASPPAGEQADAAGNQAEPVAAAMQAGVEQAGVEQAGVEQAGVVQAAVRGFVADASRDSFRVLRDAVDRHGIDAAGADQVVQALTYKLACGDPYHHDLRDYDGLRRARFAAQIFKELAEDQRAEAAELLLQLFRCNYEHPESLVVELLLHFVKNSTKCAGAVARANGVTSLLVSQTASREPMRCLDGAVSLCAADKACCQEFVDCKGVDLLCSVRAFSVDHVSTVAKALVCVTACTLPPSAYTTVHVSAGEALCWTVNRAKHIQKRIAERQQTRAPNFDDRTNTTNTHVSECKDLSDAATNLLNTIAKIASKLSVESCALYQLRAWDILSSDALWQPSTVEAACTMLLACLDFAKVHTADLELLSQIVQRNSSVGVKLSVWKLFKALATRITITSGYSSMHIPYHTTMTVLAVCTLQAALDIPQEPCANYWKLLRDACREVQASKVQHTVEFVGEGVGGVAVLVGCLAAGCGYLQKNKMDTADIFGPAYVVPMCTAVVACLSACSSSAATTNKFYTELVGCDGDLVLEEFTAICSGGHNEAKQAAATAMHFANTIRPITHSIREKLVAEAKRFEEKQQMLDEIARVKKENARLQEASASQMQLHSKVSDAVAVLQHIIVKPCLGETTPHC